MLIPPPPRFRLLSLALLALTDGTNVLNYPHITFLFAVLIFCLLFVWRDHVNVTHLRKLGAKRDATRHASEAGKPTQADLVAAWVKTADALRDYANKTTDLALLELVVKYDAAKVKLL